MENDLNAWFEHQEKMARLSLKILGDSFASKAAIFDLEHRRKSGQDAVIWKDGATWYVGPRPNPQSS